MFISLNFVCTQGSRFSHVSGLKASNISSKRKRVREKNTNNLPLAICMCQYANSIFTFESFPSTRYMLWKMFVCRECLPWMAHKCLWFFRGSCSMLCHLCIDFIFCVCFLFSWQMVPFTAIKIDVIFDEIWNFINSKMNHMRNCQLVLNRVKINSMHSYLYFKMNRLFPVWLYVAYSNANL